jgi:HK97 family phage portal protein
MIYPDGYLSKQHDVTLEKKSNNIITSQLAFADFLMNGNNGDLSAFAAIQMYSDSMPFYNAVDMRARHYSQIPIRLFDKVKDEFIDNHPVLDLLKNPNADISGLEFSYSYVSFFDITGNNFILATGRVDRPPLELINIPPQNITFGTSTKFSILNVPDWIQMTATSSGISDMFFAEEVREGNQTSIRFYNVGRDRELWHMRLFNPKRNSGNFWGMSRAKPIFLEIQQYLSGNNNNWSILKRGSRMSVAWVNNRGEELTEVQWNRLQEQADKYKGDTNAGGTPILDGMDIKDIQSKNTDMQFKELQEAMLSRISVVYGIPLAMLLDKSMTLNNLETSGLLLYDNAVMPLAVYLYDELTRFLLPRYKDTENLIFKFSESDVPVLRPRVLENAKRQRELNVNTINEIRTAIGDQPLDEGGDVVFISATLVPAGVDLGEDDEPTDSLLDDEE